MDLEKQYESEENDSDYRKSLKVDDRDNSYYAQPCFDVDRWSLSNLQIRVKITLPDGFDAFIRDVVVPKFESQRRKKQKQFAVLILISEEEQMDLNLVTFQPSNPSLTSKSSLYMPTSEEDYHNYIVARPRKKKDFHAEDIIFEKLSQLWDGYLSHNNYVPPKCFILYTWNVPCTKCTDLIIKSFNESRYKAVNVIVATTAWWKKEEHAVRCRSEERMENQQFNYVNIRPIHLPI